MSRPMREREMGSPPIPHRNQYVAPENDRLVGLSQISLRDSLLGNHKPFANFLDAIQHRIIFLVRLDRIRVVRVISVSALI